MIRYAAVILSGMLLLLSVGCSESKVSTEESKERNSSLYRRARAAEQTGDLKEAIRLYRTMLVEEPRAYSVHFQLGALLQDSERDYISALYHYKQYLALRPESEKSKMVLDRIQTTEQLLAPELLRRQGEALQGLSQAHLLKENDTLKRQVTKLEGEKSVLAEEKDRAEKAALAAQTEVERLRELLNKIRNTEKTEKSSDSAAEVAERERDAARSKTRDGKSLRELRMEAESIASDAAVKTGTKPSDTAAGGDVMSRVKQRLEEGTGEADNAAETKNKNEKKGKPEARTYTVQAGDSLFKISEKYYGDTTHWKKIRDANRTTIDPDGRIRAGQVLVIP